MYAGTRSHDNYFIILKNHGVEFNADFIFKAEWDPEKGTYHNEDNWSRIKIYKMKKDLPEVLNIIFMNIKKENLLNMLSPQYIRKDKKLQICNMLKLKYIA